MLRTIFSVILVTQQEKRKATEKSLQSTILSLLSNWYSVVFSIGEFLELHHVQAVYIVVIILDIFICISESCLGNKVTSIFISRNVFGSVVSLSTLSTALKYFGQMTLVFFSIEIIAITVIFNTAVITHWGYMTDVGITAAQLFLFRYGLTREIRVLHIFRLWRVIRLFNSLVSIEKELHDETKAALEKAREVNRKIEIEKENLRLEAQREKESRMSIEETLQTYKDEVDTLNEALKIAAMDIAEVAQGDDDDEFVPSDDEDVEFNEGDDEMSKLTHEEDKGSKTNDESSFYSAVDRTHQARHPFKKRSGKEELMRAVLRDHAEIEAKEEAMSSTFVIHEDGTFEQK